MIIIHKLNRRILPKTKTKKKPEEKERKIGRR
jgi:hypothetical protein